MPLRWREAMLIADLFALNPNVPNHTFELGGKAAGYSASPAEPRITYTISHFQD